MSSSSPSKPNPLTATTSEQDKAEAAKIRHGGSAESAGTIDGKALPRSVVITEDAVQKYVLVSVLTSPPTHFVRGDENASYHKDAAYPLIRELNRLGIPYEVLGGGRINHNVAKKTIKVYGFSYGFPWKNGAHQHDISAEVLSKVYSDYKIETSGDGY